MKKYLLSIGFLILSLFIVVVMVISRQQSTDTRSQAAEEQQITIPTVIPLAKKTTEAPYIRLVAEKQTLKAGERIPVDVYAYAPNSSLAELRMGLVINDDYFLIEENDIENTQIFPIVSLNTFSATQLNISFFITEEAGYEPVTLSTEQKIARIYIRAKNQTSLAVPLDLVLSESGMYAPRSTDGTISSNQLRSVEGVTFTINEYE